MEVISCRISGHSDIAENLALCKHVTFFHGHLVQVGIHRRDPAAVIDNYVLAVAVIVSGFDNRSLRHAVYLGIFGCRDIDALMELRSSENRVDAVSELRRYLVVL